MLKSRIAIATFIALSWPTNAFSSLSYSGPFLLSRPNPNANYLVKRSFVEYVGYTWSSFFSELGYSRDQIYNLPHGFNLNITQAAETASFSDGNNIDEIYFLNLGSTTLATTMVRVDCTQDIFGNYTDCFIEEADLGLNETPNLFNVNGSGIHTVTGNKPSLSGTVIHELGHGLALGHDSSFHSVMGGDGCDYTFNSDYAEGVATETMSVNLQTLYGSWSGALPDYYTSGNVYDSSYSVPGQSPYALCKLSLVQNQTAARGNYNTVPGFLTPVVVARAKAGDTVKVRFTVGNTVANSALAYRLYWSTNNVITTSDTQLQSGTLNLPYGSPSTFVFTVSIPSSGIGTGVKYFGLFLDPTVSISEFNEANNISWVPVYIDP